MPAPNTPLKRLMVRCGILLTLIIAAPAESAHSGAVDQPKRILLLYAHDPNAPGAAAFARQLKAVVREQFSTGLVIYEENLDLDRFPDPSRSAQLARYFTEKYQGFQPDVIVTEGSQALRFVRDRLAGLFPGAPIVYGLAFEPVVDFSSLPANITGRRLPLPFAATYSLARALHPDAERVVLVSGASPMDSLLRSEALRAMSPLLHGVDLALLKDWSYGELIDSLRSLPPRTFVVLSSFARDRLGREFNSGDLIASLTRVSSAPIYGIARNWVGDGVVGGGVMDFADDGMRIGRIVVRVLRRAPNEPMPPAEVAATPIVVDWRQLQRWGLPENRVPSGTEVLFRTPSLWERYGGAILIALGIIGFQSLLIALLLVERKRRVRAQRAVEEQVAYERLMRALTDDMLRRSPAEVTGALEDALPRVGRFATASAAVLVVPPDDTTGAATCLTWTEADDSVRRHAGRADTALPSVMGNGRLDIPLIVGDVTYGTLELHRTPGLDWPADILTRVGAVGDLIAGALARTRDGRVLEQTRGQVEHMARVATVSGLAAAVSHELRQPLTAIRMNAAAGALLLARTPPDVDEARVIFQEIVRDDARASEVIEHFRTLLRKEGSVSTQVDLNTVCRNTAKLVEHEFTDRQARLVLRLDQQVPPVRGDPVQLQQALINLTLNALDALSTSTGDREAAISTGASNGEVMIHVTDTGPGLAPDVLERVFEPFFTTKPHGLGMGLTIVRTIVERHHGMLRAENLPAGGAVFTVRLPAGGANSRS